jgi:predicted RNase H-like HicB family nuclease
MHSLDASELRLIAETTLGAALRRELPGRRVVNVRFTAAIKHEGEWFVARALEVEVTSQGQSIDEALANLREALELYFEDETLPEDIEPPIIATAQLSA